MKPRSIFPPEWEGAFSCKYNDRRCQTTIMNVPVYLCIMKMDTSLLVADNRLVIVRNRHRVVLLQVIVIVYLYNIIYIS